MKNPVNQAQWSDPADGFAERLARAQLIALNRQGRISNLIPPINALILLGMLWGETSQQILTGWVGLVWLSSIARVLFYRYFDRLTREGRGGEWVWRWLWTGAYAFSGAIWGFGTLLLFPQDGYLLQAILVIFVLGMAAGGTATFAPYLPALYAYLLPLTAPVAVTLLLQDSPPHILLGFTGLIFLVALLFLGRAANRSFTESFRLGVENQLLAIELSAAQGRLEGALDSMSEAFALFDADGLLVERNQKFDELMPRLGRVQASGMTFTGFFEMLAESGLVRASLGREREWTEDILHSCRAGDLPAEILLNDGRWLMLNHAETDDGGAVVTFTDVSDIKRHEAEISESEQRFRDFTSSASDWAWELDTDGCFTHVSGRYSDITGSDTESLIGRRLIEMSSSENQREWDRLVQALGSRQPFRNVRGVRAREDGERFHFLINGLPIFGPRGEFLGYRGTGTDITATVRAENRARLAQSQLFEAIEAIPAGFVLFDELGRLTLWNSRAPQYLPGAESLIMAGTSFEDLMRSCAENGVLRGPAGGPEAWLREQIDWFAAPDRRREVAFSDGRFVQLLGRRTADGGTVCVLTDITDIRLGQEELAEKSTFLQATLEGMGEGFVVLGPDGRAVLCNSRLERLAMMAGNPTIHGATLREILNVIGGHPDQLRPTAHDPQDTRDLHERLSDGIPFQFEVSRIGRQELLVRADPMPNGGWVCVFTDITAERRALSALAESEDRYRRLTEATPDMIAVHVGGRFVFANAAGARLLGVSTPDDLIGRRVLDFVHPDFHDFARHTRPMASIDGVLVFEEFRGQRSDGRTFDAEAMGTEFMYRGTLSTLTIWRDITERKLAQAQLVQTSKLALLGEMAASMAHELNQPLNIIRMAADSSLILMEEGEADFDSHREEFERISGQTERMATIINHLRVFSRQDDAGEQPFDPLASVNAATTMVRDQYRLDGVEVRTVLPKRSVLVRGQPIRLEQVVLNLLSNARDVLTGADSQSGNHDSGVIEVAAFVNDGDDRAQIHGGEIVITVSDTGGGIPDDALGRVFDPFFTTKRAGQGTGLGLAIGYSIVSAMGGAISASNGPKGAVFEIRLPVVENETESARQPASGEQKSGSGHI